ncbi:MAG: hypothetical protein AMJ88_07325 [Anaerolineae bacterium SM23_ 63]|nr:MAG: hypothetical protein AMJ88_07325 [Anaerolineae bacterium SM23_ 63]
MVTQPVKCNHECPNQYRQRITLILILIALCIALVLILTSCSALEVEPTSPSIEVTQTSDLPPKETQTSEPTSTQTLEPTSIPYGTPVGITESSQTKSIFETVDIPARVEESVEDLPAGIYVIDRRVNAEDRIEELHYAAIQSDSEGVLLSIEDLIRVNKIFFDGTYSWLLAGYPTTKDRYVYDLSQQQIVKYKVCVEGWDAPSLSGKWVVTLCTEPGERQDGEVVAELISLEDGMLSILGLPSHDDIRYTDNFIHWISEDTFIGLVGIDDEPCLIDITRNGMVCSLELKDHPILAVSPDYLLTQQSSVIPYAFNIYSVDCFTTPSECEPIFSFENEEYSSALFMWSPDRNKLAVETGKSLTATKTTIQYFDSASWTLYTLAEFPRDYGIVDWCPDSSCLVVSGEFTYIVGIDGQVDQLPYVLSHPIAVIEVP